MRVTWSLPLRGERLDSSRGDVVRARSLIEALRAAGHDVRVVEADALPAAAAATSGYRRFVRRVLPHRVALVLRDVGRVLHARAHAGRVAAIASAQGAGLIVETQVHFAGSGARAARKAGVPFILDDCSPASEEVALGAGLPGLAGRILEQQARAAAAVVVSSPELARILGATLHRRDVAVVPNGIDAAAFQADRAAGRRRTGLREQECAAVFVGSFQPWHRTDLLPLALLRIPVDVPLRVLLVGDGPGLEPTLSQADRLGVLDRFVCLGPLPAAEIPALLVGCDIGVLPGTNCYGQPMKLLEYAAAGLPAVAPDLEPVRDLVEPGRSGLLFADGDVAALADNLALLARDPGLRQALGATACARVGADASWQSRGRQLLALAVPARTPARVARELTPVDGRP